MQRLMSGESAVVPTKSPFTSTAVWGLVMVALTALVQRGAERGWYPQGLKDAVQNSLVEVLMWLASIGVALYGRWHATQPLALSDATRMVTMKVLLLSLILCTLTAGCGPSISYVDGVRTAYPTVADRLEQTGSPELAPNLRAAAADPVTYPAASKAWYDVAPAYRVNVANAPSLNAQRKADWLKTADLIDRLQVEEAKRSHWLFPR